MYRRDLVWHLREHHRKEHGFTDGQLVKEFVHMPKDLRKIICCKCSETEAHENAVWLAVDPNEVCQFFFCFFFFENFLCFLWSSYESFLRSFLKFSKEFKILPYNFVSSGYFI